MVKAPNIIKRQFLKEHNDSNSIFDIKIKTYQNKSSFEFYQSQKENIDKFFKLCEPLKSENVKIEFIDTKPFDFSGESHFKTDDFIDAGISYFYKDSGSKNSKIYIDLNRPDAIVHEIGHIFDSYNNNNYSQMLSEKSEFQQVSSILKQDIDHYIAKNNLTLTENQYDYFTSDDELFARSFSIWYADITKNELIQTPYDFCEEIIHEKHSQDPSLLNNYFKTQLPKLTIEILEELTSDNSLHL